MVCMTYFLIVGRETPWRASEGFALIHSYVKEDEESAKFVING